MPRKLIGPPIKYNHPEPQEWNGRTIPANCPPPPSMDVSKEPAVMWSTIIHKVQTEVAVESFTDLPPEKQRYYQGRFAEFQKVLGKSMTGSATTILGAPMYRQRVGKDANARFARIDRMIGKAITDGLFAKLPEHKQKYTAERFVEFARGFTVDAETPKPAA